MESYGVHPSQKLHKLTPVLLADRDGQVPAWGTAEHPRVGSCASVLARRAVPSLCSTSYRFLTPVHLSS